MKRISGKIDPYFVEGDCFIQGIERDRVVQLILLQKIDEEIERFLMCH